MGKNIITEGYKIYVTKLQKGTIILRTILSLKYEIIKKINKKIKGKKTAKQKNMTKVQKYLGEIKKTN